MLTLDPAWRVPPATIDLPLHAVHVWCTHLDGSDSEVQQMRTLLSTDEIKRADRFHFDTDRRHFTVARGALRRLLGMYLKTPATQVQFTYNRYGKPSIAGARGPALQFNVSHSGALALYAFARDRIVGVDIERMRANVEFEQIAQRFFSPREAAALQALPPELRPLGFYNGWTRKEAYIKAHGKGLSLPLDSFDVTLAPGVPARILAERHADAEPDQRWTVRALPVHAEYVAALVAAGADWELHCWRWAPSGQ